MNRIINMNMLVLVLVSIISLVSMEEREDGDRHTPVGRVSEGNELNRRFVEAAGYNRLTEMLECLDQGANINYVSPKRW